MFNFVGYGQFFLKKIWSLNNFLPEKNIVSGKILRISGTKTFAGHFFPTLLPLCNLQMGKIVPEFSLEEMQFFKLIVPGIIVRTSENFVGQFFFRHNILSCVLLLNEEKLSRNCIGRNIQITGYRPSCTNPKTIRKK